jgi:hypothetical protein
VEWSGAFGIILSHVLLTIDRYGLVNRFIDHLRAITTNNHYTITDFYTPNYSTLSLLNLRVLSLVFTAIHNGYSSAMSSLDISWKWVLSSIVRWLTLHNWTLNWTELLYSIAQQNSRLSHIASEWTYRKHPLHHLIYCCVTSPHVHKLRVLHSNGCMHHVSLHILHCCVRASHSSRSVCHNI